MEKGITRVGELRKFLETYEDDDFVFATIGKFGTAISVMTDFDKNESCELSEMKIYAPSITNRLVQDEIKKYENCFKSSVDEWRVIE